MGRERAIDHHAPREQPSRSFRIHDVGADIARFRRRCDVGHVVAGPHRAVPLDQLALRIPGLAVDVRRGAVVEDAPVGRPGERPAEISAGIARVAGVAPGHHIALLGPAAGIDPAAAGGRAVVAQLPEPVELLALLEHHLGRIDRVGDGGDDIAVHLPRHLVAVGPVEIDDRIGEGAALLLVESAQAPMELRHDPGVGLRFAGRFGARPVPLQPAAGIDQRALVLREAAGRKLEDLGLDVGRLDVIVDALVLPEPRRLRLERVHHHEELQLRQRFGDLAAIGER